ncbi:glutaryl-CoA dehydrogenase [Leucobacter luti]|uniref:Glutaryl-CoA dehydrogenase n=1 Tax=Leucobacter luti TaxID=340320 RepID=A0A4R6RWX3_9MICO|nr:acyl-CoA dehydrogenase family protein [Leucobacter luti]MCW2288313.1 glutaryl-CoA dehydrogenase [Leucobacter luti]TCK45530.1 glutaryl-CoA dehydrogenase [Leucobacter luti]TDP91562.1 glutaryl-CoA dehydrogenase [Leucobacter luti]
MSQTGTGPIPQGTEEPEYALWEPLDPDVAGVFRDVSAEDRAYRDRAREFVQSEVRPVIAGIWDRAEYPLHLATRLGELDLLRDGVDVPGFPAQSLLAASLTTMELARGDGSVATIVGVQGGLALRSVAWCGSEAQQERWLEPLARGTELGAFALTEPTHGSDSVSLETRAESRPGGYVLNGHKKWIGSGSVGHMAVVWARGDDGKVQGFVVPQDAPGYRATTIEGKVSLRAIWQAHIELDSVELDESAKMTGANSFKDTARVLQATRLGVAWAALGQATAVYETAVHYAQQRVQFGRPLAASQIVQARLAEMLSQLTTLQTLLMQLTRAEERGELSGPGASLGKYTATRTARDMARNARDLLGGNGILLENRVARHFADIEALHTYEGTETVQALIIGRDITGFSAFA